MFYLCIRKKKNGISPALYFALLFFGFMLRAYAIFFRVVIYSDGFCIHPKTKQILVYTNKTAI